MPRGIYIRTKPNGNKGNSYHQRFPRTEEHKRKISIAVSGKNNASWKGGVTPENSKIRHSIEYRLWREAVYARDHWNCQNCGMKRVIVAHHIKSFSEYTELRFAIDNGITLCRSCHKKLHLSIDRHNREIKLKAPSVVC